MNRFFAGFIILLVVTSCKNTTSKKVDVSGIDVKVNIDRFEQKFYNTNSSTLPALKSEYPFLFPSQNPDSVWLNRINNKDEIELFKESQLVFDDFSTEKAQIEYLFQYIKYYHSSFKEPKIITLITNLDYQNKVIYAEDFLFISLDIYLGRNNKIYSDYPVYLSQNFDKSEMQVDIAKALINTYTLPVNNRQFIDLIINEGKKMYQVDCYLPDISDAQKMGYSTENLNWVESNEVSIWKYFVENKLLYSTNSDLYTRFVADAPFSKFYLDIDKESPGRIGVWLGWQIVTSYMDNNNVTLQELLQTNAEEIFKKSKYKPRK